MPISIICPGCHARFQVSEKFAGKQGPCPKCKTIINIPKVDEQVKIHAPEDYGGGGATDTKGQPVLKPIAREETRLSTNLTVLIVAVSLVTLGLAWMIGSSSKDESGVVNVSPVVLGVGAAALAIPLVLAGYAFLRDDELEPYRGMELWIRAVICAAIYAGLWGAEAVVMQIMKEHGANFWIFAGPPFILVGAGAAYSCLDLEFGTAVLHYAFYLGVTVLLRLVMHLPPL